MYSKKNQLTIGKVYNELIKLGYTEKAIKVEIAKMLTNLEKENKGVEAN